MSYNPNRSDNYVNLKLTDFGRRQATQGRLNFHEAVFSDREVNYAFRRNFGTTEDINRTTGERVENSVNFFDNNRVLAPSAYQSMPPIRNYDLTNPYLLGSSEIQNITSIQTAMTENIGMFTPLNTGATSKIYDSDYVVNESLCILSGDLNSGQVHFPRFIDNYAPSNAGAGDLVNLTFQQNYTGIVAGLDEMRQRRKYPFPSFMHKVKYTAAGYVYLDRDIMDFKANNVPPFVTFPFVTYPSTSSESYYGSGSTSPSPVWNLNIVRTSNVVGATAVDQYQSYGSLEFNGTKQYFGFEKGYRAVGVIHYTNSYKGSAYGDELLADTIQIDLPTVLWHHFDSIAGKAEYGGLRITDKNQETKYDNLAKTQYRNLVDDRGNVVGRAYMKLKLFVITDPELLNAMSYKSNRNWTLPKPHVSLVDMPKSPLTIENTTALLNDGETLLVSYINEADIVNSITSSLGQRNAMHCGYIQKVDCQGSSKYVSVTFPDGGFPYMRNSAGFDAYSGTGYSANRTKLIAYKMNTSDFTNINSINTADWVMMGGDDGTGLGNGAYTNPSAGITIDPAFLQANKFTISQEDYTSGVTYELGSFYTTSAFDGDERDLTLGEESFLYGNVQTGFIERTHKTIITLKIDSERLNESANSTFNLSQGDESYITEVGVLNSNGDLVAVGKTTHPVRKTDFRLLVFQLEFDF
mgnify:CR=1 FL=1|jgi:hypothetical protein|tara:strand:- start:3723 stop:5801 length:2079 start_codon:yes stop_codon:yes gene_type:complete